MENAPSLGVKIDIPDPNNKKGVSIIQTVQTSKETIRKGTSKENIESAVSFFDASAQSGDVEAQFCLAYCYQCGLGVGFDENNAIEWYQKAADSGHALSQNNLGVIYYDKGTAFTHSRAANLFKKSAAQGNACAQNNLGLCYYRGHGVVRNYHLAFKCFFMAYLQGDSEAKCNLSFCVQTGIGIMKNENSTVIKDLYKQSASNDSPVAQNNLGVYLNEYCSNKQEAIYWISRSADQGNRVAISNFELLSGQGHEC